MLDHVESHDFPSASMSKSSIYLFKLSNRLAFNPGRSWDHGAFRSRQNDVELCVVLPSQALLRNFLEDALG